MFSPVFGFIVKIFIVSLFIILYFKPGFHITIMVQVVESQAEYDYVPASCPRYRRQSSILSAVLPVPYSQRKAIS